MTGYTFTGPEQVSVFVAITLRSALRLYAKTGMRVNRAYTPTTAERITGERFNRRDYTSAIESLSKWIEKNR